MPDLIALLRQLIQTEMATILQSDIGVVEAAPAHAEGDTHNYQCDVKLRSTGVVLSGVPILTGHLGTVALPNPGDVVLIQWVGGEAAQPVVAGRLYSEALRAPAHAANQLHTVLPPDAGESDRIELDLTGGKQGSRKVTLKLPSDVELTVTDDGLDLKVKKLEIQVDGKGSQVVLKADQNTVTLKEGGDLSLESGANLTIKAQGNLEVNASGNLTLKAGGNAQLKGAMVALGS
jgi:phage baseplate assembly protein gpV